MHQLYRVHLCQWSTLTIIITLLAIVIIILPVLTREQACELVPSAPMTAAVILVR